MAYAEAALGANQESFDREWEREHPAHSIGHLHGDIPLSPSGESEGPTQWAAQSKTMQQPDPKTLARLFAPGSSSGDINRHDMARPKAAEKKAKLAEAMKPTKTIDKKKRKNLSKAWKAAKRMQKTGQPLLTRSGIRRVVKHLILQKDPARDLQVRVGRFATGLRSGLLIQLTAGAIEELRMWVDSEASARLRLAKFVSTKPSRIHELPAKGEKTKGRKVTKSERKIIRSEGSLADMGHRFENLTVCAADCVRHLLNFVVQEEERKKASKITRARGATLVYRNADRLRPIDLAKADEIYDRFGRF